MKVTRTSWFYVGAFSSTISTFTIGRLILGELAFVPWKWSDVKTHLAATFGFAILTFVGPFYAFDIAESATRLVNSKRMPGVALVFLCGFAYTLVLVGYGLLAKVIPCCHLLHLAGLPVLSFLLPWILVTVVARRGA